MNDDQIGVLERERRRREAWTERGVPDPIDVLAAERTTRRLYDLPQTWHHPDRLANIRPYAPGI